MEREEEEEEDDIVCLDESFFINDNYELTRFAFGSQVLELYCLQSASTDFDLTGQMVWPGAELLNNYLTQNSEMLRRCSIIELGSGIAMHVGYMTTSQSRKRRKFRENCITGILCSRFCREVVMTDHNDEVLKLLKRNVGLHDSLKHSTCSAELKSEKLEWGNSEQLNYILQRHPEGFDLILGADIFQQSSVPLLFDTVKSILHVSRKNCRFILAYVSRAKQMDDMVINEASRHGLSITEVAGTRAVIRNLGGVIYEITSA